MQDSNFGVMRVGDYDFEDAKAVLVVNMINIRRKLQRSPGDGRSLIGHIRQRIMERYNGRNLSSREKEKNSNGIMVYDLASDEEEAIGKVTLELTLSCARVDISPVSHLVRSLPISVVFHPPGHSS
jgi:hypothetical protein